jgi:L-alanine-DL-glutamate epimerase-like enolase superfamily enzyme
MQVALHAHSVDEDQMSPGLSTARIEGVQVAAYTIPTSEPESDGTLEWNSTTLVTVEVTAAGHSGVGYSYADSATARLIHDKLAPLLNGQDALALNARWSDMVHAIRNLGRAGIASMAISAVDTSLWDLKAKLYGLPLAALLGMARTGVHVYGSGGFTSYTVAHLQQQLEQWAESGMRFVKMKVGRRPDEDAQRVRAARQSIGPAVELFVDANGAYTRKQALAFAKAFADADVTWFEEPVSSDDLPGLNLLRNRAPAGMAIAAGEYGFDSPYFRRMLDAGAVDVLQADATRCAGITGFMTAAALCEAACVPLSSHCAPGLHLAPCCAARSVVHMEYFHDHARIEQMLFDGAVAPRDGKLTPDLSRPGLGVEFKHADANQYAVTF